MHGIPAAGEETKPAHPQQEAPVTAASGPPWLLKNSKVSQPPAQHVSAAIGERSGQSATMENFCADKFPSLDSENDGNFRP